MQNVNELVTHTVSASVSLLVWCMLLGVWTLEEKGQSPNIDVTFDTAKPTLSHLALVTLEQAGRFGHILLSLLRSRLVH